MVIPQLTQSQERPAQTANGGTALLLVILLLAGIGYGILPLITGAAPGGWHVLGLLGSTIALVLLLGGIYTLQPNESAVITLFSNYKGTDRHAGLRWVPFWYGKKKISVRARNITSPTLKVNDKSGSPIEIGAVVVWRVADTARALFDVDNYTHFINIQIETALREIASHFAYDSHEGDEASLRGNGEEVGQLLRQRLQERIELAGLSIVEAKLSHLAYAPEIAGAMLRRQQAEAVLAARAKIVHGAVSMVESALQQLSERGIVQLDDERRAAMVSNLLVVLCGDRDAQPVVNTGTLYS